MINRGERFQANYTIESNSNGGGSVMVWAGVFLHHKTCLHKGELNCSSLSTRNAGYGGHSIVGKPQKNAVAA